MARIGLRWAAFFSKKRLAAGRNWIAKCARWSTRCCSDGDGSTSWSITRESRDKTFSNMSLENFRAVVEVHLFGSVNCTKAVWEITRQQQYGRIVFTTSSSGLYGNFGQSNYGAAKLALVGLMNTLHLEGAKYDVKVNCLAPCAGTRMLAGLASADTRTLLAPESVTPGLIYLVSREAPSRIILAAGAGGFARARVLETEGIFLTPHELTAEAVAANWEQICAPESQRDLQHGGEQSSKFLKKATALRGG
jgi:NAD(P)-dependent dehydrogenase (short-subunit alcohol dehydrogenase family)